MAIDERLTGAWRCVSPTSETTGVVTFTARGHEHAAVLAAPGDEDEHYRVLPSDVGGGRRLLNVDEGSDGTRAHRYDFVRYAFLRPDVLALDVADEKPFAKGTNARDVLERDLDGDGVFEGLCVCVKVPAK